MEKETYRVEYICDNCGTRVNVDIDKGVRIPVMIGSESNFRHKIPPQTCGYCGCLVVGWGRIPLK